MPAGLFQVAAAPLDPSRTHEIEIHHEGEVIQKAGDDVYFIASRGTWYPRLDVEFAQYDMTFRYPKNLTLVARAPIVPPARDTNVFATSSATVRP